VVAGKASFTRIASVTGVPRLQSVGGNAESDLKGGRREPSFFGCYYPEADYL
jgi:hypothetical protein